MSQLEEFLHQELVAIEQWMVKLFVELAAVEALEELTNLRVAQVLAEVLDAIVPPHPSVDRV